MRIQQNGRVTVISGAGAQGQGHGQVRGRFVNLQAANHVHKHVLVGQADVSGTKVGEDATSFYGQGTDMRQSRYAIDGANIEVLVLATGERRVVQRGGSYGRYLPSGLPAGLESG